MVSLHRLPRIELGRGVVAQTGPVLRELGHRKVLLATSRGMPGRPALDELQTSLRRAEIETVLFAGTPAEPGEDELAEATELARRESVQAVVGFGGGSALDLAKLAAVLAIDLRPIGELYGIRNVGRKGLPTVMLPTTAGSGSEVSQDAVLTDRKAGTKRGVKDPMLVPDLALVDPAATDTCPPAVTAASGLDSLCHAIEAWTNRRANPICDLYAERSIRLIRQHLVAAVQDGAPEARDGMAEASLLAGLAFSPVGTAAVHACGYPLSGIWGLPHGVANSLMLPPVVAFNRPAAADKVARLQSIFDTDDLPAALRRLAQQAGVPTRLRDAGVERNSIPRMAAIAADDQRHLAANPRPMDAGDLERVFIEAW
ncbi:MAG: iron-containing alcohol dehydrogenase [Acidobacteriota bacterium]|nr:iron-containing alcohol dehydrogenase [Acidobacteriota bacterium]